MKIKIVNLITYSIVLLMVLATIFFTFFIEKKDDFEVSNGMKSIDNKVKEYNKKYKTVNSNESVIVVKNGGNYRLEDSIIEKEGKSLDLPLSDYYGNNSGILVINNSKAKVYNTSINTNSEGSNGVFVVGHNSSVYLENTTITTKEASSRGIDATYGGKIIGNNIKVNTDGWHSASIASDRGGGNIEITNSTLISNGEFSPALYVTGNFNIKNSSLNTKMSEIITIEGFNNLKIENSSLKTDYYRGMMIYCSMDKETGGKALLDISNSSISVPYGPLLFINNTETVINIENTKISQLARFIHMTSKNNDPTSAVINLKKEIIEGNIYAGDNTSIVINMKESTLKTSIEDNKSNITIKMDNDSSLELKEDVFLNILINENKSNSNIISNGFNIYYDKKIEENNWLDGKIIELKDGGKIIPR